MGNDEYYKVYSELNRKFQNLIEQRAELESQVGDISKEIDNLGETLNHLAPLAGLTVPEDITSMGITQATRSVLGDERLSTSEIKAALEAKGYDFSTYSAPEATIRTVLARLVEAGKASMEKEGWKVFYTFQRTDDEIPF
jgi:RNase H-fold protein (predicted Holliday junction resolvase)